MKFILFFTRVEWWKMLYCSFSCDKFLRAPCLLSSATETSHPEAWASNEALVIRTWSSTKVEARSTIMHRICKYAVCILGTSNDHWMLHELNSLLDFAATFSHRLRRHRHISTLVATVPKWNRTCEWFLHNNVSIESIDGFKKAPRLCTSDNHYPIIWWRIKNGL